MDVDGEVLDWGAEEDDHYERQRRQTADVDDLVSLGGEEDDMEELVAFKSRTGQDSYSPVDPQTRSNNDRGRDSRREPSDHRRQQDSETQSPPKSRGRPATERGSSPPPRHSQVQKGPLHASLPPKPVTSSSQYRSAPQSSLMSASAMSGKQRIQDGNRDKERDRRRANGSSQHPAADDYGPLPPDWEIRRPRGAENNDQIYYYNTRTEESQWERPGKPLSPRRGERGNVRDLEPRDSRQEQTSPERSRSEKHAEGQEPVRNERRNTGSARLTFDDRHYRPSDTNGVSSARRAPTQNRDQSPPHIPRPADLREPLRGNDPLSRQDNDTDKLSVSNSSRHPEGRDSSNRSRRDSLIGRPSERIWEESKRATTRVNGAPTERLHNRKDQHEDHRNAYADRDYGDTPRNDDMRSYPQRRPRSRSPSPIRNYSSHGRDPVDDLRKDVELLESRRAVEDAYRVVSQRRQEAASFVNDHPPRRLRDVDDVGRNGQTNDVKRRRTDDMLQDHTSRPLRDADLNEYHDSRQYNAQVSSTRSRSPPYHPRQPPPRATYDTPPHLAAPARQDGPRVDRLPDRPPPPLFTPNDRSEERRASPPGLARDSGRMNRVSDTSTSRRNGPPPAEHSYRNDTPRRGSSGLQPHVPASYDREPNGVSRSDSRRTDDYELRRDGRLDRREDYRGGNDMEIDFDGPPNYRRVPSNERLPPTGPNDRRGREPGTKGVSYDKDYEREQPREWIGRDELPKGPRAMSSQSELLSPITTTGTLPPSSVSPVNTDQRREPLRAPPSVRGDDAPRPTRHIPVRPEGKDLDTPLPQKKQSRFAEKVSPPVQRYNGGRDSREARGIGSGKNVGHDAPLSTTRDKDDPDRSNPFATEEGNEEKKVRTTFEVTTRNSTQQAPSGRDVDSDYSRREGSRFDDRVNVLGPVSRDSRHSEPDDRAPPGAHSTRISRFSRPSGDVRNDDRSNPRGRGDPSPEQRRLSDTSRSNEPTSLQTVPRGANRADTYRARSHERDERRFVQAVSYDRRPSEERSTANQRLSPEELRGEYPLDGGRERRLSSSRDPQTVRLGSHNARDALPEDRDLVPVDNTHPSRKALIETSTPRPPGRVRSRRLLPADPPSNHGEGRGVYVAEGPTHSTLGRSTYDTDRNGDVEYPDQSDNPRLQQTRSTSSLLERLSMNSRGRDQGPSQNMPLRDRVDTAQKKRFPGGTDHYEPDYSSGQDAPVSSQDGPRRSDNPPRRGRTRERPRNGRGRRGPRRVGGPGPNGA